MSRCTAAPPLPLHPPVLGEPAAEGKEPRVPDEYSYFILQICYYMLMHVLRGVLMNHDPKQSSNTSQVNDLGNPKTRKIKELPAFYEVKKTHRRYKH